MGEILPAKVRPAGAGSGLLRSLIMAAVYIALIPLVAALGLVGAATYFPGPTRALMGPALARLLSDWAPLETGKAEEALAKSLEAESRLSKIEEDIAGLVVKAAGETPVDQEPSGATEQPEQVETQIAAALAPVRKETAGRDRMLAGLSALTLARSELLAGNREVAQRELGLAQTALASEGGTAAPGVPADLLETLGKASDALSRGSSTAGDWLSLAWHTLADALLTNN
ncbi:MAG: hypothetical protein WD024_01205 [Bacillota bacterium]